MKLSTHIRYGLRAMLVLAEAKKGTSVSIKEIAANQNVSEAYLRQIFFNLRKSGLIASERGKNGGYLLGREAKDISVLDIANALEESLNVTPCIGEPEECPNIRIEECCKTRPLWASITDAITEIMANTSLKSIAERKC